MVMTTVSFFMIILYNAQFKFNYSVYVFGLIWGLLDSGLNSHCGMILGFEFEGQSAEANGIASLLKSLIMAAASFVSGSIFKWD